MPTYEYRCTQGHEFEQVQKMSDPPIKVCAQCGAPAERLLSRGGGLLFKGSGFYTTDYRSDKYRKAAESDQGSSKPAADKSTEAPKGSDAKQSGTEPAPSGSPKPAPGDSAKS
jgi:putative FmdB family regulatory protein